jgi:hypothetical protein
MVEASLGKDDTELETETPQVFLTAICAMELMM